MQGTIDAGSIHRRRRWSAAAGDAGPCRRQAEPDAIKTTFFNGQEFIAATPSGVKFKMVFTPDGKVTRTPAGNYGAKGEGTWKLSKEGFCTTWKGGKPNCYTLVAAGDNKWSVMQGPSMKATWSK